MTKIGILTYWGVPNYGAWTQAYALNNVVNQICGDEYDVRHIAYLTPVHNDAYYKTNIRLKNSFKYSYDVIPHTETLTEMQLEDQFFDVLITGSDAIWEFSVPEMGNDRHLIGNNLKTNNLISYAASFGVTSYDDDLASWVADGLFNYKHVSVRDVHSQNTVDILTNGKVKSNIVCDPALLWDFKDDKNVKECLYDHYIAVYGTNWSDEYISYAKDFAQKHNCKLISLGWTNSWCDVNLKMIELRGLEWIGMFKNADYVFTSTFHGLMVSLSFEKEIKFFQTSYVANRSATLISEIGLKYVTSNSNENDFSDLFENNIEYKKVKEKISIIRKNSYNWLRNALES